MNVTPCHASNPGMTNMKLTLTVLLLAVCVGPMGRADDEVDAVPEALQPFAPLVEHCVKWHGRRGPMRWAHHNNEPFDREHGNWRPALSGGSAEKVPGKSELLVTAPPGGTVFVPVGPAVRGPLAVEMVARANDKAVPLGIMLDHPRGKGPGFLFSTRPTGQHVLWTDKNSDDHSFRPVVVGAEPKLVVGRDYRVRLEIRDGKVLGYVDGKLISAAILSQEYDENKLRQPMIMTVVSSITVQSVTTEKLMPDPTADARRVTDEALWAELFGPATREQVETRVGQLIPLLDHDRWVVREGASEMIRKTGEFARPALRQAVGSDSPEVKMRARLLLKTLGPLVDPSVERSE